MKKLFYKKSIALLLIITILSGLLTGCSLFGDSSKEDDSRQENVNINLGNGLYITDIGSYTGIFMEDGTDDVVSDVLMIVVTNTGDKTLQYASVTLPSGETDAEFEMSTLPAGKSIVLLETNRMPYDKTISHTTATVENVVFFTEEPLLMEDKIKVRILDGVINITNISDEDIDGEIVVYYKNSTDDLYYGGITYRTRVTGGLKAGETRQVAGAHASKASTVAMFVQIV